MEEVYRERSQSVPLKDLQREDQRKLPVPPPLFQYCQLWFFSFSIHRERQTKLATTSWAVIEIQFIRLWRPSRITGDQ